MTAPSKRRGGLVVCPAKVPPSPCGDDRKLSGSAAEFWTLLAGSRVQLTPEETGVVRRRLEESAAKRKEEEGKQGGRGGKCLGGRGAPHFLSTKLIGFAVLEDLKQQTW